MRSWAAVPIASVKSSQRERPRCLARYMAVSALRKSANASSPGVPVIGREGCDSAIPMLTLRSTSTPLSISFPLSAWLTRSATSTEVCSSMPPSHITTNSSPPMRAMTSAGRVAEASRLAIDASNKSPTSWPALSLTSLSRSRSTNNTAICWSWYRPRLSASASVRSNSMRLGSPVSGSCVAWWASSA